MREGVIAGIACSAIISFTISCGSSGGSGSGGRELFVDSVSGNDANDGLTESTAWSSIDKVNSFALTAGDTVRFKKGAVFSGGLELTASGNSDNQITFDAYGSGANPVFLGSRTETGWASAGNSIYQKMISYTPGKTGAGIVLEDGAPLTFKEWNSDASTSLGATNGVFTYDPEDLSTGVIYIRCTDSADPSTHTIDAGYYLIGVHSQGVSHIAINNIDFMNYSCHGVSLRNSHNITVKGCSAKNTGGAVLTLSPSLLYGGNGFEFTLNSSDCTVTDSSAVNIFDSGFSPQVFESGTTTRNVKFENCIADKCGFAGIEISVLSYNGSSGEKIENVTVSGCAVTDCGKGWSGRRYGTEGYGVRVKADTGAGTMTGISITRTKVSGCAGSGIFIAGETGTVDVSRASISGNSVNGITCFDDQANATLRLRLTASCIYNNNGSVKGISYAVNNGNGFEIVNNTFYGNTYALWMENCGGPAILKNNIFYSSGDVYLYTAGIVSGLNSDYNCFYEHGGNIIGWGGTAYSTMAAYKSGSSKDANSIGSDPNFVSISDFQLQSGSPCENSGVAAGVIVDYEGNPYGATPSRGAFR